MNGKATGIRRPARNTRGHFTTRHDRKVSFHDRKAGTRRTILRPDADSDHGYIVDHDLVLDGVQAKILVLIFVRKGRAPVMLNSFRRQGFPVHIVCGLGYANVVLHNV